MLRLPRIAALDLRPPHKAIDRIEWDWPELPRFLKARVIRVVITADTSKLDAALRQAQRRVSRAAVSGQPFLRRRPMRLWFWERILLWLGSVIAILTCAGLLVDAWL